MRGHWKIAGAALAWLGALSLPAQAQQDPNTVEIKIEKVAEGVLVLYGQGGNIGVSVGDDGVFLIDDQYAPLTERIRKAVASISDKPIRFLLNTHWHGDHTGGNENLGGHGVLIFAHDNVRVRMSSEQFVEAMDRRSPPSPAGALPVVTFGDTVSFHINGDTVHGFHVSAAHTDGDSIVHFRKANVVHMGDVYFSGFYPFIDYSSGGSIDGVIDAVEQVLEMIDDQTRVIPGHGQVSGKAELTAYRDMLVAVRDKLRPLAEAGKTVEEAVAAKPTAELDAKWGKGWLSPDKFVHIAYTGMLRQKSAKPAKPGF